MSMSPNHPTSARAARSLTRAACALFAYVQRFEEIPPGEQPGTGALRAQILEWLTALEESPEAHALSPAELEATRFALVTWIDEKLLRTTWPGREEWVREPLQLELYRTSRGGDEFFERLAALPPGAHQARGVFFACLCFGFEGRLAGREAERRALIARQYELLAAAGAVADPSAARPVVGPTPEELAIDLPPVSRHPVRLYLISMAALVALASCLLWLAVFTESGRIPLPPGS